MVWLLLSFKHKVSYQYQAIRAQYSLASVRAGAKPARDSPSYLNPVLQSKSHIPLRVVMIYHRPKEMYAVQTCSLYARGKKFAGMIQSCRTLIFCTEDVVAYIQFRSHQSREYCYLHDWDLTAPSISVFRH